jgi:hypothetical protein
MRECRVAGFLRLVCNHEAIDQAFEKTGAVLISQYGSQDELLKRDSGKRLEKLNTESPGNIPEICVQSGLQLLSA